MPAKIISPPASPVRKSLTHRTISSAVMEALRERILDGSFESGMQLRQDALAEEFGVSRIPVREALMQLEAEGLVKILPHRGAVVSELSLDEINELFELRSLLEPRLLRLSAPKLREEDFEALDSILAEFEAEGMAGHARRWGPLNNALHMRLYAHAERPRSLALVSNLLQECDRHTRLQLSLSGSMERAQAEHRLLVKLCAAGRIGEAVSLLSEHIAHAASSLAEFLSARQGQ